VRGETVRRVRGRPVRLGVAGFNIAAGTSADLALRVGDAGREAIDRFGGTTRIRLVTSSRDEAGPGRDGIARFVLRRG
jgi:hypothetical protein